MDAFLLVTVLVIEHLYQLTAQQQHILRAIGMPMDRHHRSRQQRIQHTLRIIVGRSTQVEVLTQARISHSLLEQLT